MDVPRVASGVRELPALTASPTNYYTRYAVPSPALKTRGMKPKATVTPDQKTPFCFQKFAYPRVATNLKDKGSESL